jgi:hypothetical protein
MDLNSQQILHDFHVLKNSLGLSEMIIDEAKYLFLEQTFESLKQTYRPESLKQP